MNKNKAVLNYLPGEIYITEDHYKIIYNCKCPLLFIQAIQNKQQTNTRSLENLFKLNIGANVMLILNMDIQDRLINSQRGNVRHSEFAGGSVRKVYVSFPNEKGDLETIKSSYLGRKISSISIKKCETEISIK